MDVEVAGLILVMSFSRIETAAWVKFSYMQILILYTEKIISSSHE
jgi:hypothetical protein